MQTLIIIPTYNEKENIAALLAAIRDLRQKDLEVLIVDDSSPDGTADIVLAEAKKPGLPIHLLSRKQKNGLGKAYAAGFAWALERNYTHVISMDADFSHDPKDVPRLLAADAKADIVIGSRYIPGGKIEGWDWKRNLNSKGANIFTRLALGLKPKDVTAGFKRYNRAFLESLNYSHIISSGYAFQVEMIFNAARRQFRVVEIPITFVDRRAGQSKISGELKRSVKIVWRLFIRRRGVREFVKFCIVGATGAVIDWVVFSILKTPLSHLGQTGKQLAKAGSFVVSGLINYILNRRWTFRSTDKRILRQSLRFFSVATLGLVLNNIIFYVITAPNGLHLADLYGLVIATAGVALWNFYANRRWTFNSTHSSTSTTHAAK